MKSDKAALLFAFLFSEVIAQSPYGTLSTTVVNSSDPGISTSSITICPSATNGQYTVTAATTETYCPATGCQEPKPTGDYTVWSTVYKSVCPTGTVDKVYTITESCPCAAERTEAPGYLPPGFGVTSALCSMGCGETPTWIPITAPTAAPSAPAAGPPSEGGSVASPPAPAGGAGSPPKAGAAGAGSGSSPSGGIPGGSNSTGSTPSKVIPPITSFTGAASRLDLPVIFAVSLGGIFGVLAWQL